MSNKRIDDNYKGKQVLNDSGEELRYLADCFRATGNLIMAKKLDEIAKQIDYGSGLMLESFSGYLNDNFIGSQNAFFGTMGKVLEATLNKGD